MTEPEIYAVISQKGGSGKTTLAINLAVEAFLAGKKAMIIDTDLQGSAATWSDLRDRPGPEVRTCFPNRLPREIGNAAQQGFDCIVIDTAGHANDSMVVAARLSHLAIIACRPQIFDLATMRASLDACLTAQTVAMTVFTAAPNATPSSPTMRLMSANPPPTLSPDLPSPPFHRPATATDAPKEKASSFCLNYPTPGPPEGADDPPANP